MLNVNDLVENAHGDRGIVTDVDPETEEAEVELDNGDSMWVEAVNWVIVGRM